MKAINIIGLLLVILTSTVGNKTAPGRYCAYSYNDTVWAFGQTKEAENDKHGFWVFLDRWGELHNLHCTMNFADNKRNGWLIEFHGDSLQRKAAEVYYKNDTAEGTAKFYNTQGELNHITKYQDGEMTYSHYIIYKDFGFVDYMALGKDKPDSMDSMMVDATSSMEYILPFWYNTVLPEKDDRIIVFNSWSNAITTINVVICCILLILNILNTIKRVRV